MEEEVFSNALPNYEFKEENKYENQELIKGIAINPMIRENFNSTDNREIGELLSWWINPFIVSKELSTKKIKYDVRILNGGAWDRSSFKESYDNLEDAVEFALSIRKDPRIKKEYLLILEKLDNINKEYDV